MNRLDMFNRSGKLARSRPRADQIALEGHRARESITIGEVLERETRLELATSTLARLRSTN
jgi:hypothetical protein